VRREPGAERATRRHRNSLVGQLEQPDGNGLIGAIWTAPASILGG
jgi:hypothetical protein